MTSAADKTSVQNPNSKANLLALVQDLTKADNNIAIFGGWAVELLDIKAPWAHSDIDLLLLGDHFDNLLDWIGKNKLKIVKSYAHKKAFIINDVMAEVFLVSRPNNTTKFVGKKGETVFQWPSELFIEKSIHGHTYRLASKAAMDKYTEEHDLIHANGPWE